MEDIKNKEKIEIFIADDNSSDKTIEVANSVAKKFKLENFYISKNENATVFTIGNTDKLLTELLMYFN